MALDRQGREELLRLGREQRLEMELLESRERRREFQDLQQFYREIDRRDAGRPAPRLEVPKMQGGCALQLFGNSYVSGCR